MAISPVKSYSNAKKISKGLAASRTKLVDNSKKSPKK